jgi:thiamine biosynthesis lipoprotein
MTATIAMATPASAPTTSRRFRAMGTQVAVQLVHDAAAAAEGAIGQALDAVEARFSADEAELSRFRTTSGLTRLSEAAGKGPQPVSALLLTVAQAALDAAAATDGMFDPTLGTVLAVLGYDRPFPLVAAYAEDAVPVLMPHHRIGAWRDVRVDPAAGTIALPGGVALDFGGIGKGWTVDELADALRHVPGVRGGLINAGGDLRVWGMAPAGAAVWGVGVEDPAERERDCAVLGVNDVAVATSSTAYRRWRRGDRWVHHLLDPRTGQPATTDAVAVTVIGPSAMWAEVHAKVALLQGMAEGRIYLEAQQGYTGLLIGVDGTHGYAHGMEGYLA